MKKITSIKMLLVFCSMFMYVNAFSQGQVFDVVSIGAGYTNQSFYSMTNGEISNVDNADWELAFQISGFEASILINGKNNVHLFRSGLDINAWSTMTANDTIGYLNSNYELFNQDTSWWAGAFNLTNDTANQFDLGWGVYDFATHVVVGDSLYFLQMPNGNIKKLWIQALQNGIYNFAYADVDGTNEVNATLNKLNFAGKNFGYYSITNGVTLDREPIKYNWDLTFWQYVATTPFVYKVTGVLANDSVTTCKVYPVDINTATPWGSSFTNHINTIGYEWKSYDFNINAWAIEDSIVYFVNSRDGGLWKMVFTNFGGAANGNFEFYKEQISATGVEENGGQPALLGVYPNPASTETNVTIFIEKQNNQNTIGIFDVTGKKVQDMDIRQVEGLKQIKINTQNLKAGIYYVKVIVDGLSSSNKLLIVHN